MPQPPPAHPGQRLSEVDTPALIVDLDAFEHNLEQPARLIGTRPVRLRPHAKTHKSADIALRQIGAGGVGVCCQKVSEAGALVAGGVADVLVTNEVVGAQKLARLVTLARVARVGVCVDDPGNVSALSAAAGASGSAIEALVEVDVGQGRAGVQPGAPAVALARAVSAATGLEFGGLQAYGGGNQHLRSATERAAATAGAAEMVRQTVAALAEAGLACRTIAGAGTGTFEEEAAGPWNELQPGSYLFLDADYARNEPRPDGLLAACRHALFVLTTVMSRPVPARVVCDAGHKAISLDSGPPLPVGLSGAIVGSLSDEHTVIEFPGGVGPELGERILLIPGHCDPTVNLHEWFVCVRGLNGPAPAVEAVWPVTARGAHF